MHQDQYKTRFNTKKWTCKQRLTTKSNFESIAFVNFKIRLAVVNRRDISKYG